MRQSPLAHIFFLIAFVVNSLGPVSIVSADQFVLPKPGAMVHLSPEFNPPILKGIKVHTDNPFRFDFILDKGDSENNNERLKEESSRLIKYFLASVTIPEKDLWVNLSPYERDRIIPTSFGLTEMGRDLLAEDYMLKQITASLIYPEDEVGRKFWKRIYEEAQAKYHTTNIPVNTFNKVWIIPERAVVYENAKAGTAYVVESKLKVMLEEDYIALEKTVAVGNGLRPFPTKETNQIGSQIVREIVIPELTKEINENQNFTQLRQVYSSLILATWYKQKIKDSVLSQVYADKAKTAGVNIDDPKEKEKIYKQYVQAFKKGVYNYIKDESDPISQKRIPRKYFSGGVILSLSSPAMKATTLSTKSKLKTVQKLDKGMISRMSFLKNIALLSAAVIASPEILASAESSGIQEAKKATSVEELFLDVRTHIGDRGENRLRTIVDFKDVKQLSDNQKNKLRDFAEKLQKGNKENEELSNEVFEFYKQTMGLEEEPLSIAELENDDSPYTKILSYFKTIPGSDLRKYIDLYRRLFKDASTQNIFRSGYVRYVFPYFLESLHDNQGRDVGFLENVLNEFPQLFNPSVNYGSSFDKRIQDAVVKINSLPSFLSVKDAKREGYHAFDNDESKYLLRRYWLAILNFYQQAFPLNESRRAQVLLTSLFKAEIVDFGKGFSNYRGPIDYRFLTDKNLLGILGHEEGHGLDLFGMNGNKSIGELIGDLYGNLLTQYAKNDFNFEERMRNEDHKIIRRFFLTHPFSSIKNGQAPVKDEHYYAREQLKNLMKIIGKDIDWKIFHLALQGVQKDYQNGLLNQRARDFIDMKPDSNGIIYFSSFAEELIRRYPGKSFTPTTIDYPIEGNKKIKTVRLLAGNNAMLSDIEIGEAAVSEDSTGKDDGSQALTPNRAMNSSRWPSIRDLGFYLKSHVSNLYHDVKHSLGVSDLSYDFGKARKDRDGLTDDDVEFLGQLAEDHDFDPDRPANTPASVERTLQRYERDWNNDANNENRLSLDNRTDGTSILKSVYKWDKRKYLLAKAIIARSDYPFWEDKPEAKVAQARYESILDEIKAFDPTGKTLRFALREGAYFSEYVDKTNGYGRYNFKQCLTMIENLVVEYRNREKLAPAFDGKTKIMDAEGFVKGTYPFFMMSLHTDNDKKLAAKYGITDINFLTIDEALDLMPKEVADVFRSNRAGFKAIADALKAGVAYPDAVKIGIEAAEKFLNPAMNQVVQDNLIVNKTVETKSRGRIFQNYEVSINGKEFDIKAEVDTKYTVYSFFNKNSQDRIGFIYTVLNSGHQMAISGIKSNNETQGLAKMMTTVLVKYFNIQYLHSRTRNGVLMYILTKYFNFKPSQPATANAVYLDRKLTEEEIKALGFTPENFPKDKKIFISKNNYQKYLGAVVNTVTKQYIVTDQMDWIAKDPSAIPLYLGADLKMNRAMNAASESLAQKTNLEKGGIDFTASKTPLEVRNAGESIDFKMNPAMLTQLQNAPGFTPVIINIQPLDNLPLFLGIKEDKPVLSNA
jgi:hypothetical protein